MAERAGGGTSLRGLRERMGERAGGSRGGLGPAREAGFPRPRGLSERRDPRRKPSLRSRLARRRVLPSPPPERPGTGRGAERGRGREGRRPARATNGPSLAAQLPPPTAVAPRAGGAREN